MKVVIVGGSISGLVHGVMLKHHGHDVHILERVTRDLEAQGAGVGSHTEAAEFLKRHDRVKVPMALPSHGVRVYNRDSKMVQQVRLPMEMNTWDALYYRLRANFDNTSSKYCPNPPPDEETDGKAVYDMGKEVTGIDTAGPRQPVSISYRDVSAGEACPPIVADLVIGADGAASIVKRLIAPNAPPRNYAGYVAWRGVIPETAVSEATRKTLSDWFTFHVASKEYVVVYPIPGQYGALEPGSRGLNFVWYSYESEDALKEILKDVDGRTHRYTVPLGKLRPEIWERQKAHGLGVFSREFGEMLEVTDKPFVQVVTDCAGPSNPGPAFEGGRVIIVGDANTVLRPHTGFALSQTAHHCLELEARLPSIEAALMQSSNKEGSQVEQQAAEKWNTKVLEFSHVARLRSVAIGMLYLGSKPAAVPYIIRWKLAELWVGIKNLWRNLTGTRI